MSLFTGRNQPAHIHYDEQAIVRAVGWKFTGNEIANTVLEYIHAHYYEKMTEEGLSVKEAAEEVGYQSLNN